ncbi:MAG: N-acetyl-1-D-myo-inositol-2-amino-2-deoxy-alpha-D-glucopyranoside deacetylase [Mycobacteriales bacterium]
MTESTLPPDAGSGKLDLDPAAAVLAEAATAVDALEAEVEMTPLDFPQRLLLVHAHPDDETIGTGATMARYAAAGARVTLVTCTLGEEGEIVDDDLAHLASDREDGLGQHRIGELAAACEALGVRDHRFLGGPGRWRDSGMMGTPQNERTEAFWNADLDSATALLVAIVRETRPQVVITYDANGGYGHPDHIRAHDVTVAAFEAAGDPGRYPDAGEPWAPAKLYFGTIPKSVLQAGIDYFREQGEGTGFFGDVTSADDLPMGVPDDQVTTAIDAREQLAAKTAAMRAHRSQIRTDGPFFALADGAGRATFGIEYYILAAGERGPGSGPDDREDDLFAGLS